MKKDNPAEKPSLEKQPLNMPPIPTQVPKTPDMSRVPHEVLKSKTIASLIQHNEDLSARLTVTLKQLQELEGIAANKENELIAFQQKYENVRDQLLILKEKSNLLFNRKKKEEEDFSALKKELHLLTVKYNHLHSFSQQEISIQKQNYEKIEKRFKKMHNFKERLKSAYRQNRSTLDSTNTTLSSTLQRLESIQIKMNETTENFQQQLKETTTAFELSEDQLQKEAAQLSSENVQLENENKKLLQQNKELKELFEVNVSLKNNLIEAQRQQESHEQTAKRTIHNLTLETKQFKEEAKKLATKKMTLESQVNNLTKEIDFLKTTQEQNKDHNENIELLWRESQKQLEELKDKNNSLQKLNKSLSTHLNDSRRDYKLLLAQTEQKKISSQHHSSLKEPSPPPIPEKKKNYETLIEDLNLSFNGAPPKDL